MSNSMESNQCDVAIVGAGPYGLSLAAHLSKMKVSFRIFGSPMGTWLSHMPAGMSLKSEGFASDLYHPDGLYKLKDYCAENGIPYADMGVPVTLDTFSAYGIAFQKRFVPDLDPSMVTQVTREGTRFRVVTEADDVVLAKRVVIAAGIKDFGSTPPALLNLPAEYVSHSSRFHRYDQFKDKDVIVIGGGSSAIDVAVALHEAGARPQLVTRKKSVPFHLSPHKRSLYGRIRAPWSGLGPGWRSRLLCDLPHIFHRMSPDFRLNVLKTHLGPAAGWFTRDKMQKHVPMHHKLALSGAVVEDGKIHLTFTDAENNERAFVADHVVAGTGYRVDLKRLKFLEDEVCDRVATIEGSPILSRNFESSVPGLYFVGTTAAASFGPLLRFAFGAGFASRQISKHFRRTLRHKPEPVRVAASRESGWAGAAVPEEQ